MAITIIEQAEAGTSITFANPVLEGDLLIAMPIRYIDASSADISWSDAGFVLKAEEAHHSRARAMLYTKTAVGGETSLDLVTGTSLYNFMFLHLRGDAAISYKSNAAPNNVIGSGTVEDPYGYDFPGLDTGNVSLTLLIARGFGLVANGWTPTVDSSVNVNSDSTQYDFGVFLTPPSSATFIGMDSNSDSGSFVFYFESADNVLLSTDLQYGETFSGSYAGFLGVPVGPLDITDTVGNVLSIPITVSDNGDGSGTFTSTNPVPFPAAGETLDPAVLLGEVSLNLPDPGAA